jgi:hypothetical protein
MPRIQPGNDHPKRHRAANNGSYPFNPQVSQFYEAGYVAVNYDVFDQLKPDHSRMEINEVPAGKYLADINAFIAKYGLTSGQAEIAFILKSVLVK